MERKFFKEITILLLPPILDQLSFDNTNIRSLSLSDLLDIKATFAKSGDKTKEDFIALTKKMLKTDSSKKVVELIGRAEIPSNSKLVIINYPMNGSQLEILESELEIIGISVSNLVVSNLLSFDLIEKAKKKYFVCPICLKSYAKESNLSLNSYLCPIDKETFNIEQIEGFTEFLTTYYLQNSIQVVQNFASTEKEKQRKTLKLTVDSEDRASDSIRKSLLNIFENN